MNVYQIMSKMDNLGAEFSLLRNSYKSWPEDERWACVINLEYEGNQLKVRATGPSGETAITNSFDKLERLLDASQVVKVFNLPLLTIDG